MFRYNLGKDLDASNPVRKLMGNMTYIDLLFLVIKGLLSLLNKNNASQKG